MRTRLVAALVVALAVAGLALPALAAAPIETLAPAALKGEPKVEAGKAKQIAVWVDAKGIHVRWTSDGKPALFAGSLELDKPVGEITRTRKVAGGWVQTHGERIVMFSATARDAVDGFDLAVPGGGVAKFEAQLDGKAIEPDLVVFGEGGAKAKALPVKFKAAP